jgi:hypothetical protein
MTCCVSVRAGMFWLIIGSPQNLPQHKKSEQQRSAFEYGAPRTLGVAGDAPCGLECDQPQLVLSTVMEISDGGSGSITLATACGPIFQKC